MKSAANKKEKHHQNHHLLKKEYHKFHLLANLASLFFYLTCITLITIFSLHLISHHSRIKYTRIPIQEFNQTKPPSQSNKEMESSCDLFKGRWVPDPNATLYTNFTCSTIPLMRNCFLNGRRNKDFLNWKWKPDRCELPRFNALSFLSILRGKKMAFIGDSLARNQMESLLCLLSTVETPKLIEKDADDKFTTWEFPNHNFTLAVLWSQFLVAATEITANGTATTGGFHLHLDRVDTRWSDTLPTIDYAVFSDAHWFFRQNHLYEDGHVIGCIYCQEAGMTDLGPGRAIRMAFRAAFRAVNECKNCKKIVSFLRTYSPAHFEGGAWNAGGGCNRTRPVEREEVNQAGPDSEYRKIQEEEVETARNEGRGSNEFEILDVTEMMAMRVDGHPGLHSGNRWMKGTSDCIHWCLPGPIDTWNALLLERIKRLVSILPQHQEGL